MIDAHQADQHSRVLGMAALFLAAQSHAEDFRTFDLAVATVRDYADACELLTAAKGILSGQYQALGTMAPEEVDQPNPEDPIEAMQSLVDFVGAIAVMAEAAHGKGAKEMLIFLSEKAAYESAGMAM